MPAKVSEKVRPTLIAGLAKLVELVKKYALTERLSRLPYADQDAIRVAWAELTNTEIDPTFRLIPPVYSDQGVNIRVGRDVFINHNCTLNDIGGIAIGDEVLIGPRVSLITSGHPIDPAFRRRIAIGTCGLKSPAS